MDFYEELRPESDSALPARALEATQGAMEQGMRQQEQVELLRVSSVITSCRECCSSTWKMFGCSPWSSQILEEKEETSFSQIRQQLVYTGATRVSLHAVRHSTTKVIAEFSSFKNVFFLLTKIKKIHTDEQQGLAIGLTCIFYNITKNIFPPSSVYIAHHNMAHVSKIRENFSHLQSKIFRNSFCFI